MSGAARSWDAFDLVDAVRVAIHKVPESGRFGGDRVFVSALWRALDRDAFPGLTFDDFKSRLVTANRQRHIALACADLVGAMNMAAVVASEITYLNSTFHFVVDFSRTRK